MLRFSSPTFSLLRLMARRDLPPAAEDLLLEQVSSRPVDWRSLLEAARHEGISPLVRRHLRRVRISPQVPPRVLESLDAVYYAGAGRTARIRSDARTLFSALASARIPAMVLKGGVLGPAVYGNIGLRPAQDLDFMVPREAVAEVHRECRALGYTPYREPVVDPGDLCDHPGRNSLLYRREESDVPLFLHLHWHLVNASYPLDVYARRLDIPGLWEASLPWNFDGIDVRILSARHMLLHLAEHALKHCYERLILPVDAAEFVHGLEGAWAEWREDAVGARSFRGKLFRTATVRERPGPLADARGTARRHSASLRSALRTSSRDPVPCAVRAWNGVGIPEAFPKGWAGAGPSGRFWSGVREEAARMGLTRPLAFLLVLGRDLLGTEWPSEAEPLARLSPMRGTERWFLRAVRAGIRSAGVNWLAYLAMMESWGARAAFLHRAILPARADLARLDGVEEVGWIHYAKRLRQAVGRGWTTASDLLEVF